MASEGRSMGLDGQIHCALGFFFFVEPRWWQVVVQAWRMDSGIPPNKVGSRCLPLLLPSCGESAVKPSLGCLPRWKAQRGSGSTGTPPNKLAFVLWRADLKLSSPPPCFHGDGEVGDEEFDSDVPDLGMLRVVQSVLPLRLLWLCSGSGHGEETPSPGDLPRWTMRWEGESNGGFFNKLGCCPAFQSLVTEPSMSGHHGDGAMGEVGDWVFLRAKMELLEANTMNMMIYMKWYAELNFHHVVILKIINFSLQHTHKIRLQGSKSTGYACIPTGSSFGIIATGSKEQGSFSCFGCTISTSIDDSNVEDIVPLLFGLCHRRWTTAPSLLILRFNRGDSLRLSLVKPIQDLQLNSCKPRVHTPERLLGESPTGHQLVWSTKEALEDGNCSKFESELSTDDRPLFDSNCSLRYLLCKSCSSRICSKQLSKTGSFSVVQFVRL